MTTWRRDVERRLCAGVDSSERNSPVPDTSGVCAYDSELALSTLDAIARRFSSIVEQYDCWSSTKGESVGDECDASSCLSRTWVNPRSPDRTNSIISHFLRLTADTLHPMNNLTSFAPLHDYSFNSGGQGVKVLRRQIACERDLPSLVLPFELGPTTAIGMHRSDAHYMKLASVPHIHERGHTKRWGFCLCVGLALGYGSFHDFEVDEGVLAGDFAGVVAVSGADRLD